MVNPAHISTCPWRDDLRCSKATHRVCVQFSMLDGDMLWTSKILSTFFHICYLHLCLWTRSRQRGNVGLKILNDLIFSPGSDWPWQRVQKDENSKFSLWTCWRDRIRELPSTGHGSRFSKNRDRQTDTHTHTHTHVLVHVHTHIHIHMPYISICICIYTHYIIYISILSYPILSYPILSYPILSILSILSINQSIYQSINVSINLI